MLMKHKNAENAGSYDNINALVGFVSVSAGSLNREKSNYCKTFIKDGIVNAKDFAYIVKSVQE